MAKAIKRTTTPAYTSREVWREVETPQEDKILERVCLDPGESACGRAAQKKLLPAGHSLTTSSLAPFQKAQNFIGHPQERERWSCRSVAAHAHEVVAVSLRPGAGGTQRWNEMRGGRKNRV